MYGKFYEIVMEIPPENWLVLMIIIHTESCSILLDYSDIHIIAFHSLEVVFLLYLPTET